MAWSLIVVCMLTIVACGLRLCGGLKRVNFELITVLVSIFTLASVFLCTKFHSARAFGKDPQEVWLPQTMNDGEVMSILAVIGTEISVCLFIPVRSYVMWLVPLVGSVVYPVISLSIGTTMPGSVLHVSACIGLCSAFLQVGGRRHEGQMRRKWRALQEAKERDLVARGLEEMSWLSCELLVRLDHKGHVIQSGRKHDAFFGQSMQGKLLLDVLAPTDREHFAELLQKAKDLFEVQSMPVSFELSFASVRSQLAILGINGAETCFLLGVSQVEHTHREEATNNLDTINEEVHQEAADAGRRLSAPSEFGATSVAQSTATEHIFNDIDRLVNVHSEASSMGMKQVFGHLVDMGLREHWLIATSEVTILNPCVILGIGSFGCVALGRYRGATVAVKAPRAGPLRSTEKTVASFCNELRYLRRVRHANIVAFHGATIDPASGELAMVFEYVEGLNMDLFVQQTHAKPSRREVPLMKLLVDVCTALAYLHGATPPIVHGDIKASNIKVKLMDGGVVNAKLLDFGLSRLQTRKAKPLGGTVPWMAPELFNTSVTRVRPAPSADVYSFGLLSHFAVTGICPIQTFDSSGLMSRFDRLRWPETAPFWSKVPPLVKACMAWQPPKRPATQDVLRQLTGLLKDSARTFDDLGKSVVGMLATTTTWDEGMKVLRAEAERQARAAPPASSPRTGAHTFLQTQGNPSGSGGSARAQQLVLL